MWTMPWGNNLYLPLHRRMGMGDEVLSFSPQFELRETLENSGIAAANGGGDLEKLKCGAKCPKFTKLRN